MTPLSTGVFHVDDTELYADHRPVNVYTTPAKENEEYNGYKVNREDSVSRGGHRKVLMNVSAYTSSDDECGKSDNITASGRKGIIGYSCASDSLPMGTKVLVNGRIWEVMDRFGGGYGDRLDLMMGSKEECFNFGRKWIEVEVIE